MQQQQQQTRHYDRECQNMIPGIIFLGVVALTQAARAYACVALRQYKAADDARVFCTCQPCSAHYSRVHLAAVLAHPLYLGAPRCPQTTWVTRLRFSSRRICWEERVSSPDALLHGVIVPRDGVRDPVCVCLRRGPARHSITTSKQTPAFSGHS